MSYNMALVQMSVRTARTQGLCHCIIPCSLVLSYRAECSLLLLASADGNADIVSLNFNWKLKRLPGSPLNQYIFLT